MTALVAQSPPFEFVLYPNHALPTRGFIAIMVGVALVGAGMGTAFMLLGAWPVTGFLGLDVLALFLAFRWIRRRSRCLEIVRLERDAITVRRIGPGGEIREARLDAYWARVSLLEHHGRHRLVMGSHGRLLEIGQFLTRDEKGELARALEDALARVR